VRLLYAAGRPPYCGAVEWERQIEWRWLYLCRANVLCTLLGQTLWFQITSVSILIATGAGIAWWMLSSRHRRFREEVERTHEERRKHELELHRQRNELAHLSRVMMLGQLSGSLAHELNQPLTAILINAEAAQEFLTPEKLDLDEVRSILQDIVRDDKRAGEVIRRLLVMFQKGEVQQQSLDINEVVQAALKLVQGDLMNQNVVAEVELAADLPKVKGDKVQLQQVLLLLIANGCDAMTGIGPSDRKLTLRTELVPETGVQISVIDRGTGIPPDQMENIFLPFFTTKKNGMGLGLAVCRSIVSAHGGKLCACNKTAKGARFNILLPAAK